jgi:hypothetical protein
LTEYEPFIKEVDVRGMFKHCGEILAYIENREEKTAKITFASKNQALAGLKKFRGVLSHKRIKMPMSWEQHDFGELNQQISI